MSIDVVPSDWTDLDSWWTAHAQTNPMPRSADALGLGGREHLARHWDDLDCWWQAYTGQSLVAAGSDSARVTGLGRLTDCWEEIDSWWDVYTETGHETAVEVADLLEQSNNGWHSSGAPFDTDPLSTDLSEGNFRRGPLRPGGEVAWSRWLARLLRPSRALIEELFDMAVEQAPNEVIREEQVPKSDGTFRRPDLLVVWDDHGVSIEVKLGDENYGKTAETAQLVERYYDDREWTHVLLLPKSKKNRLNSILEPELERREDGQRQIMWEVPGPVDVVYWRDVTAALRTLLRQGVAVDDHWAANAYLFCAVAEQRLLGFQPRPAIEKWVDPKNFVETVRPIGLVSTLEEQLTYLRERGNS